MRLKSQVLVQALVPGIGLLALVAFGTSNLGNLNDKLQDVTEVEFGRLVNEEVPELNARQDSIALLLNADRDGYQAHLAEFELFGASSPERLDELRATSEENRQQVVDRVRAGAASLSPEAMGLLDEFETKYAAWVELHVRLMDAGREGQQLSPASVAAFGAMRDVIDRMQEAQEAAIATSMERLEAAEAAAKASAEEAQASTQRATQTFMLLGGLGFLVFVGLLIKSGRSMAVALERALGFAKGITHGDLNQSLVVRRKDEFGDLAAALTEMQTSMRTSLEDIERARVADREKTAELEAAQEHQAAQAAELERANASQAKANAERIEMAEREAESLRALEAQVDVILGVIERAASGDLTGSVEVQGDAAIDRVGLGVSGLLGELRTNFGSIASGAGVLDSSSSGLSELTTSLNSRAETTAAKAETMASTAREVSVGIETVASAAEQMEASIREIASQTSESVRVANQAATCSEDASRTMGQLDAATGEIRQIVQVITAIAKQTNLLALNATIEAARAGEAGKGFAVVANEVKDLAQATAAATQDIAERIESVESTSGAACSAIEEIAKVIRSINDMQSSIAGAIEEQTATTAEIVRSVNGAARGSQDIAQNAGSLAETARATLDDVASSRQSTDNLAHLAGELSGMVAHYTL